MTLTSSTPRAPASASAWRPLVLLALGQLLIVLDDTVVNIALPQASAALSFAVAERQWVVTGYAAAFAALLPLGGQLADRVGPRRMVLAGSLWFAAASILGAAAPDAPVLVVARILQGMGAGLLGPAVLSSLSRAYPVGKPRTRAFSVFAATSASGAVVGLLLGGALAQASWRLSLGVSALLAAPVALGSRLLPAEGAGGRINLGDALLALIGLLFLVTGLADTGHLPGTAAILGGLVLLGLLGLRQRRSPTPAIPLGLLRGQRGASLLALLTGYCGIFAVFLFLTFVLQGPMRLSPLLTGLAYLPMTAGIGTASAAAAALLPRVGAHRLVPVGMIIAAGGLGWLALLRPGDGYLLSILGPTVVLGVGLGTVFATATNVATDGARAAGVSAALVNIAQQVGIALGTALLSGIATLAAGQPRASAYTGADAAFAAGAAIFLVGALATAALLLRAQRRGAETEDA